MAAPTAIYDRRQSSRGQGLQQQDRPPSRTLRIDSARARSPLQSTPVKQSGAGTATRSSSARGDHPTSSRGTSQDLRSPAIRVQSSPPPGRSHSQSTPPPTHSHSHPSKSHATSSPPSASTPPQEKVRSNRLGNLFGSTLLKSGSGGVGGKAKDGWGEEDGTLKAGGGGGGGIRSSSRSGQVGGGRVPAGVAGLTTSTAAQTMKQNIRRSRDLFVGQTMRKMGRDAIIGNGNGHGDGFDGDGTVKANGGGTGGTGNSETPPGLPPKSVRNGTGHNQSGGTEAFPSAESKNGRGGRETPTSSEGILGDELPPGSRRKNKPSLSGFMRTVKAGATTSLTKATGGVGGGVGTSSIGQATSSRLESSPAAISIPKVTQKSTTVAAGSGSRTTSQQRSGSRASRQDPMGGTSRIHPSISGTISPGHHANQTLSRGISGSRSPSSPPIPISRASSALSIGSGSEQSQAGEDHYTLRIACTYLSKTILPQIRALRRSSKGGIGIGPEGKWMWYQEGSMQTQMEENLLGIERMERAWGIEWMLKRSGSDLPAWAERTKQKEADTFQNSIEDGLVLCFLVEKISCKLSIPTGQPSLSNGARNLDLFLAGAKALRTSEAVGLPKGFLLPFSTGKIHLVSKIIVALARMAGPDANREIASSPDSALSDDIFAIGREARGRMTEAEARESRRTFSSGDNPETADIVYQTGLPTPTAWASYTSLSDTLPKTPTAETGRLTPTTRRVSFTRGHLREITPSLITGSSATPRTSAAISDSVYSSVMDSGMSRPKSPLSPHYLRSPPIVRPLAKRGVSLSSAIATSSSTSADGSSVAYSKLLPRQSLTGQGTKMYVPKQSISRRDSGVSIREDADIGGNSSSNTSFSRRDRGPASPLPDLSSRRSSFNSPEKNRQRHSIVVDQEPGAPPSIYVSVERCDERFDNAAITYTTVGLAQTLGNLIGKGQFGEVYRAMEKTSGQFVAVKRIDVKGLQDNEVKDILNEVELLKGLSHPGIVKYSGMRRDQSVVDIVLE